MFSLGGFLPQDGTTFCASGPWIIGLAVEVPGSNPGAPTEEGIPHQWGALFFATSKVWLFARISCQDICSVLQYWSVYL